MKWTTFLKSLKHSHHMGGGGGGRKLQSNSTLSMTNSKNSEKLLCGTWISICLTPPPHFQT